MENLPGLSSPHNHKHNSECRMWERVFQACFVSQPEFSFPSNVFFLHEFSHKLKPCSACVEECLLRFNNDIEWLSCWLVHFANNSPLAWQYLPVPPNSQMSGEKGPPNFLIVCKCCDENQSYWGCGTSPTLLESLWLPPRGLHKRERSRLPTLTSVQYQGQGCSYFNSEPLTPQGRHGGISARKCLYSLSLIQTLQTLCTTVLWKREATDLCND